MAYQDGPKPKEAQGFDIYEAEDQLKEDREKERKYEQGIENVYRDFETVDAGDVCKWKALGTFHKTGGMKLISITSEEDCYAPTWAIDWMREVEFGGCPVNVGVWRMNASTVDEIVENMGSRNPSPGQVMEYAIGNMDTSEFLDRELSFHSLRNSIQWAKENL